MTIVLFFVIFYLAASALDIAHVNNLLDRTIGGLPGKPARRAELPPAPRLVIPGQSLRDH